MYYELFSRIYMMKINMIFGFIQSG